jgi:hypothetical protein
MEIGQMLSVSHNFTPRRAPAVLTIVVAICGLALVAYFVLDLIEFAATSASASPDFVPSTVRAP